MSFFKTAVILGIGIALLPSDRESQRTLTQAALSATANARSFCDTRPNICLSREEVWDAFITKAGFAVSLSQELIWGQTATYQRQSQRRRDGIGSLLDSELGDL